MDLDAQVAPVEQPRGLQRIETLRRTVSIFAELLAQRIVARAGRPCHNFRNY
jgi:hypothetical protein